MPAARTKLVNLPRDIDNQMRGQCKGLVLVLGKAGSTKLVRKVKPCSLKHRIYTVFSRPPLVAQSCLKQIEKSDRQLLAVATGNQTLGE
ncbi:hypothetical protein [Bradyrhizobium sp. sGM-13]|uniref:hypothetical protein n=1 Tax=Bradyrhizobium sp. sGM-13 TaxID=2831781 RepID=UPI001BCC8E02|nr:hypothetical protein [Bradyrhizobium sp. sGM-13]